jgi:hypothetical protein
VGVTAYFSMGWHAISKYYTALTITHSATEKYIQNGLS